MNKQPQVTEQTRANLTRAFWELYLESPIDKITVRAITDRAGYNRATFYLYFRDVYDVLERIEEEVLAQIRTLVNERLLQGDTFDLSQHTDVIARLAQRFNTVLPRLMTADPAFEDGLKEIIAPLLDRFIIPERGLTESEQDVLREFYLSGMLSSISFWVGHASEVPIERFCALVVGAVVFGAAGPTRSETPVIGPCS